eukprot:XP_016878266.1 uncharacterized protein LOC105376722 [Homo sapiens]
MDLPDPISWQLERKQRENGLEKSQSWFSLFPHVQPIVFKEKLTMKTDSLMEEKLECSLWCCLSDPSTPGRCCVLERRIVPWMRQESYSSSSPIWFVDSDEPNLTSVLECLEDAKNNNSEYFVKTVKEDVAIGADCSHECYYSSFPQLKEYWQRKSPGIPEGANRKKKINGSSPDTATSGGYHSPGDSATGIYGEGRASSATLEDLESQYQELAVALDSSSTIISQLTENINSLVRVQWGPLIPACESWTPVSSWGPEERG